MSIRLWKIAFARQIADLLALELVPVKASLVEYKQNQAIEILAAKMYFETFADDLRWLRKRFENEDRLKQAAKIEKKPRPLAESLEAAQAMAFEGLDQVGE